MPTRALCCLATLMTFLAFPTEGAAAGPAADAVRVTDGTDCQPSPQEALAGLAEHVAAIRERAGIPRPCVPPDDPRRAAEERRELEQIEDDVKQAIDKRCETRVCTGNALAFAMLFDEWMPPGKEVFAGCEAWSELAADAIGSTSYFRMRREQRCTAKFYCHYVVVLENARTGETHVVDAWSYAGGWDRSHLNESRRSGKSVFGSWDEFRKRYVTSSFITHRYPGRCLYRPNPSNEENLP